MSLRTPTTPDLLIPLSEILGLDPDLARDAAANPRFANLPVDRLLVEAGLAEEEPVARALAECFGLDYADLRAWALDPEVLALVPPEVARNFMVLPIACRDGLLTLAMADPLDVSAEDVVRLHTGYPVRRVVASRSQILRVLTRGTAEAPEVDELIGQLAKDDVELLGVPDEGGETFEGEEYGEEDAPIIQLVNALLVDAIAMGASDVHVEPQAGAVRIRYRVDGALRVVCQVPKKIQNAVTSRLKLVSTMDISEKRRPQDGRTRVRVSGRAVDLRVSTLPSYYGEKVVLRILDRDDSLLDLDRLGMEAADLARYRRMFNRPQGMLLITGPTGSGKTSTLYGTLRELNEDTDNIVTVEDPIEFQLPGITQVQLNVRAGVTFSSALRSILRQDPDIIMVGEIRDPETAEIAIQSAQTGHLVLSTLHTNSAAATIVRLGQIGVAPYLVADALLGVVAQRLVRRLCPDCRQEERPDPSALAWLARSEGGGALPDRFYTARGCDACGGTGFRGRLGVYEVVPVTPALRNAILQGQPESLLARIARDEGARSLVGDGLRKVAAGETSLHELLRVVSPEQVAEDAVESSICDLARRNSRSARVARREVRTEARPGFAWAVEAASR